MYVRKRQYYHHLVIIVLIKNIISVFLFVVITTLFKVEVLHYRHAKRNDVITMYDIIKFYTDIIYWII